MNRQMNIQIYKSTQFSEPLFQEAAFRLLPGLCQGLPIGPLLYTISCMHCMTVSLAQGGDGLGAMWGKEMAVRYFQEAGFRSVAVHELAHDFQNYYYVCRP